MEARRVGIGGKGSNQAVLAAGIRAVNHQQQSPLLIGPEPALVFANLFQAGLKCWYLAVIIQQGRILTELRFGRVQKPCACEGRILHQGNSLSTPYNSTITQDGKLA